MPDRKYEEIIKDLRNKVYHPVYFLQGEEPYYIDAISNYMEDNVLNEMEKEFNQTVLYGRDTDIMTIVSAARRFPMMSNYQVVIVKEAQDLKWFSSRSKDDEGAKEKGKEKEDPMMLYLQNPTTSTLLVFCYKYKKVDSRTKVGKLLKDKTQFLETKKLYDNQVPAWIKSFLKEKKINADDSATELLAQYLGNDLAKISNEVNKMMLNLKDKSVITAANIQEHIGISKDYNVFELQNALGVKNILKANQIINYFAANPKNNPFPLLIASLFAYFNKLLIIHFTEDKSQGSLAAAIGINPFIVKEYVQASRYYPTAKLEQIIGWLREYDLKSKGVGSSDQVTEGDLMKELVFKILH
ncbi:MAG: DNA polymerase III subunit delta [Bacteroidetes bacterium]|jgi:DNA polymerase-3 subunit delta|nr:DNA polymerase III subunit delta [Bacteroidota bacterium]